MQKRVNTAGLTLLFLEKLACKVGPGLLVGTWILEGFPPFPDKNSPLFLNYVQRVWFVLNASFPSGNPEFWYGPQMTNPGGTESLMSFPG